MGSISGSAFPPGYGFWIDVEFSSVARFVDFLVKVLRTVLAGLWVEWHCGDAEYGGVGARAEGFDVHHKIRIRAWGAESHISTSYGGRWLRFDVFWADDLLRVKRHVGCPGGRLAHDVMKLF